MKRIISLLTFMILIVPFTNCGRDKSKLVYTGIVEGKIYSLSSPLSDDIIYLPFQEGNEVRAGELVALIDTTDVALQIKQVNSRLEGLKFQLQNAELQLDQAKTAYDYYFDKYQKNMELSKSKAVPPQTLKDITRLLQ